MFSFACSSAFFRLRRCVPGPLHLIHLGTSKRSGALVKPQAEIADGFIAFSLTALMMLRTDSFTVRLISPASLFHFAEKIRTPLYYLNR
jgi:hypothetical protein